MLVILTYLTENMSMDIKSLNQNAIPILSWVNTRSENVFGDLESWGGQKNVNQRIL